MTDAEAQAPEVGAAVGDGVLQAIVAAVPAAQLQPHDAARQIEFVMRDQDFADGRLEVVAQRADRQAAAIHVRLRLQQPEFRARHADPAISPW